MFDILGITGPIYIAIFLGFASVRWGLFSAADMRAFGRFVLNLALPAMLFNALAQRPVAEILSGSYVLAYLSGSLLVVAGGGGEAGVQPDAGVHALGGQALAFDEDQITLATLSDPAGVFDAFIGGTGDEHGTDLPADAWGGKYESCPVQGRGLTW